MNEFELRVEGHVPTIYREVGMYLNGNFLRASTWKARGEES